MMNEAVSVFAVRIQSSVHVLVHGYQIQLSPQMENRIARRNHLKRKKERKIVTGSEQQISFMVAQDIMETWNKLKERYQLDDAALAAFLLKCYEDKIQQADCPLCQSPLGYYCSKCFIRAPDPKQLKKSLAVYKDRSISSKDYVCTQLESSYHKDVPEPVPIGCREGDSGSQHSPEADAQEGKDGLAEESEDERSIGESNVDSDTDFGTLENSVGVTDNKEEKGMLRNSGTEKLSSDSKSEGLQKNPTALQPLGLLDIVACNWCDVSFKSVRGLTIHMITHTSVTWQMQHLPTPRRCGRRQRSVKSSTRSVEEIMPHLGQKESDKAALTSVEKTNVCIICGVYRKSALPFCGHLHKHIKKNAYKCLKCEVTFKFLSGLTSHLRTHPDRREDEKTYETSQPYQCRICGVHFKYLGFLANHAEKHTEPNPFWCKKCQCAFAFLSDFTSHECRTTEILSEEQHPFQSISSESTLWKGSENETILSLSQEVLLKDLGEELFQCSLKENVTQTEDTYPNDAERQNLVSQIEKKPEHTASMMPEAQVRHSTNPSDTKFTKEYSVRDVSKDKREEEMQVKPKTNRGRKRKKKQLLETERRHQCPHCPAAFKFPGSLVVHSQKHTGQNAFPCPKCNQSFSSKNKLLIHQDKDHWGSSPITCHECGKVVSSQQILDDHLRLHTGEKPYKCDNCGELFQNRTALARHRRKHRVNRFKCKECGATFHYSSAYLSHMNIHATVKPHLCCICGQSFPQVCQLQMHSLKHGQKQFVCEHCGKAFYDRASHKMHSRTHLLVKPFACEQCSKSFVALNKLRLHQTRVHLGLRPHKCSLCDAAYATVSRLREHVRASHTSERPYRCPICNKSFAISGCRQAHLRTHSESEKQQHHQNL